MHRAEQTRTSCSVPIACNWDEGGGRYIKTWSNKAKTNCMARYLKECFGDLWYVYFKALHGLKEIWGYKMCDWLFM